ncbi:MAG: hypothetical protein ACSHYB_16375 [Roseibacillus sp.]
MRHLSIHNPTKRKLPPISNVSAVTRGVEPAVRADSEVTAFIWGISFFFLLFLAMVGGRVDFAFGVVAMPVAASLHVVFSKMSPRRAWAWTVAGWYCVFGTLWVVASGTELI